LPTEDATFEETDVVMSFLQGIRDRLADRASPDAVDNQFMVFGQCLTPFLNVFRILPNCSFEGIWRFLEIGLSPYIK
jgi:hypothetical protein